MTLVLMASEKGKKNLGRGVYVSSWQRKKLLYGREFNGRERIPHGDLPYILRRDQFNGSQFTNLSIFHTLNSHKRRLFHHKCGGHIASSDDCTVLPQLND